MKKLVGILAATAAISVAGCDISSFTDNNSKDSKNSTTLPTLFDKEGRAMVRENPSYRGTVGDSTVVMYSTKDHPQFYESDNGSVRWGYGINDKGSLVYLERSFKDKDGEWADPMIFDKDDGKSSDLETSTFNSAEKAYSRIKDHVQREFDSEFSYLAPQWFEFWRSPQKKPVYDKGVDLKSTFDDKGSGDKKKPEAKKNKVEEILPAPKDAPKLRPPINDA